MRLASEFQDYLVLWEAPSLVLCEVEVQCLPKLALVSLLRLARTDCQQSEGPAV